jgi:hypothetical protein
MALTKFYTSKRSAAPPYSAVRVKYRWSPRFEVFARILWHEHTRRFSLGLHLLSHLCKLNGSVVALLTDLLEKYALVLVDGQEDRDVILLLEKDLAFTS